MASETPDPREVYVAQLEAALVACDADKRQLLSLLTSAVDRLNDVEESLRRIAVAQEELTVLVAPEQNVVWDFRDSKTLS